ncbi:MAG: YidC/Oxa1 family membrane protein insertase [Prevotella sp.]|nr:YidC/Oxa1 family membrane protein insertase [Prevotella sp.]
MNIQFPSGDGIQGFVYWLVSQIMGWGWVSYGFAIVFFTLFIKLMLSPLDFLNRLFSRRTQIKQQALAGELADIQQTYQNDPLGMTRARQALYQKHGVGGLGSSLISLASIILTMVVFFNVMGALNNISNYNIRIQYEALQTVYREYTADKDVANLTEAQKAELSTLLNDKYADTKVTFGWIKNIWQPDSPLASPIKSAKDYNSSQSGDYKLTTDEAQQEYEDIYSYIQVDNNCNGFFLLAVFSAVTVFLSMKINAMMTKRHAPQKPAAKKNEPIITYSLRDAKQQGAAAEPPMIDPAQMTKMMMWIMPIIYVFFATMQTSAFAIYMIASSLVSTALSVSFGFLVDLILRHTKTPDITKDFDATVINPHAKYFKGGKK